MAADAKRALAISNIKKALCSPILNLCRFTLDGVSIRYLQYSYIAGCIESGKIRIEFDDGRGYNHNTDTLTLDAPDLPAHMLVHEATHAIIDACNSGLMVSKGTHEACAYLAESIYAFALDGQMRELDIPPLNRPMFHLAKRVATYNTSHTDSFVIASEDLAEIKAIMKSYMNISRLNVMNGLIARRAA